MKYSFYLVTGATGYLGRVITDKLRAHGAYVRALVMPDDKTADELPPGTEIKYGRVDDAASMEGFFAGDLSGACLINCAGIISIATRRDPMLKKVNIDGARNVIDLCMERGVARVVHVSTVHAIPAKPYGETITEAKEFSPLFVRGHYAKSKAAATQYALDAAKKGLDISVVHPSGIIGPYDGGRSNIAAAVISFCKRKLPAAVRGGYDFVDVRDVADGIISCAENGRAGECYILSGHYASLPDIFGHLSRIGYGREPRYLPLWFVKILSPFFELDSLLKRKPLFLTAYSAYTLGCNAVFSHKKATRELCYSPRSLKRTLDDMAAWLCEKGLIPRINGRQTH